MGFAKCLNESLTSGDNLCPIDAPVSTLPSQRPTPDIPATDALELTIAKEQYRAKKLREMQPAIAFFEDEEVKKWLV
jgi:hypothetical protein